MAKILNEVDARKAAQNIIEQTREESAQKRNLLMETIQQIESVDPSQGGFEEIAALLALPDEHFILLAPVFLAELERSFGNVNNRVAMAQAMNAGGVNIEDVTAEYGNLCYEIDNQMSGAMSVQKRDFLKEMLGIVYNSVSETEGVSKRNVLIPIEYCRENAKMPTYAHLTDAGMDVYLTEDVVIRPGETKLIPIGIKVALPLGYELQVRPKSGRSLNSKLRISNTPGTIDAGYRDEIGIIVDNIDPVIRSADVDDEGRLYNILWGSNIMLSKGEKIAQLVLSEVPKAIFYEVETVANIGEENRGGGFGSTGDK